MSCIGMRLVCQSCCTPRVRQFFGRVFPDMVASPLRVQAQTNIPSFGLLQAEQCKTITGYVLQGYKSFALAQLVPKPGMAAV